MEQKEYRQSPTFKIALGVFALVGFLQLMAIGLAYSSRGGLEAEFMQGAEPEIVMLTEFQPRPKMIIPEVNYTEKPENIAKRYVDEKPKDLIIGSHQNNVVVGGSVAIQNLDIEDADHVIRHPRVAKLLSEANRMYVNGDVGKALLMLQNAADLDSAEPAVIDMQARVAEDMGALAKARDLYLKNFATGLSIGRFYHRAAYKLENGVGRKPWDGAMIFLEQTYAERDGNNKGVTLNIPVRAREGETIIGQRVQIHVYFYDLVSGEKVEPAGSGSLIKNTWLGEIDWRESGLETLRVKYSIGKIDQVESHLYGSREYFGQVIELYYNGELQDMVAQPSVLHKDHAKFTYRPKNFAFPDGILNSINMENPLLPDLSNEE